MVSKLAAQDRTVFFFSKKENNFNEAITTNLHEFKIKRTTAAKERYSQAFHVSVQPNPSQDGWVWISAADASPPLVKVEMLDISGVLFKSYSITGERVLKELPGVTGLYILKIYNSKGEIAI